MLTDAQIKNIHAVLFDLDGTLLHTSPDLSAAAAAALAECGLPPVDAKLIENFVGKGIDVLLQRCLTHLGRPEHGPEFEHFRQVYMHHYERLNGEHATPYPGVFEGLNALRDLGLKLGVCTNKSMRFTDPLLERAGMSGYFAIAVSGDTTAKKKPDAAPILYACEAFGFQPAEVLMVGDSANDAGAARAAGSPVLVVPYGYNEGEPVQNIDSDGIVADLAEVAALLLSVRGARLQEL
ncbi:MAG TPA: phosphoglycolate phosphatase [Burkholderiales bacterium]|jgi:phosphoglycolate phosphatase|nr:phosphoglycolate phosphatase [Burkholderiales bacterium]